MMKIDQELVTMPSWKCRAILNRVPCIDSKAHKASATFNQFAWTGAFNNRNISAKRRYLLNKKYAKSMQFEFGLYP